MDEVYVDRVKAFVSARLTEEFSLGELAEAVGYSVFHLSRQFKRQTGQTVMEYAREQRVYAAAEALEAGQGVLSAALAHGFDTHAGLTKAFTAVLGCTPQAYRAHAAKRTTWKGATVMEDTKIVIRHVCKDDVNDLWENCYSAMTPRQIMEVKILPNQAAYEAGRGLLLVAEADGRVVKTMGLTKWAPHIPLGLVGDNLYRLTGGAEDAVMRRLVEEMGRQARQLGVETLLAIEGRDSASSLAFQGCGFARIMTAGETDYLMRAL